MKSIYARDICKVDKHILVRIKCYVRKLTCIFNVFNFNGNSVGISEYSVGNNVEQYMILFIWIWFDKSNVFLYFIYFILEKFRGIKVHFSEKFKKKML